MNDTRKYRITLIGNLHKGTGNNSTILRLKKGLLSLNYLVTIIDSYDNDHHNLTTLYNNTDLFIGLHAYHSGILLNKLYELYKIKYFIILGGTDINCYKYYHVEKDVIYRCLLYSHHIISFNTSMKYKLIKYLQNKEKNISIIPQSIILPSNINQNNPNNPNNPTFQQVVNKFHINLDEDLIFLALSSIRIVKDPFYIVNIFQQYYNNQCSMKNKKVHLILGGTLLDNCSKIFEKYINLLSYNLQTIDTYQGVTYINMINNPYEYLNHSHIFINTSINEGMSGAILEAMSFNKILILARNNQGNQSIIKHQYNGLLYNTPEECYTYINKIYNKEINIKQYIKNAYNTILKHHNFNDEINQYHQLINNMK